MSNQSFGIIVAVIGLFDILVMPIMLERLWESKGPLPPFAGIVLNALRLGGVIFLFFGALLITGKLDLLSN